MKWQIPSHWPCSRPRYPGSVALRGLHSQKEVPENEMTMQALAGGLCLLRAGVCSSHIRNLHRVRVEYACDMSHANEVWEEGALFRSFLSIKVMGQGVLPSLAVENRATPAFEWRGFTGFVMICQPDDSAESLQGFANG